jgi:hypothetical protein
MNESLLQIRTDEIQAEMLREAANWRLAKEARAARTDDSLSSRLRRLLTRAARPQSRVASASATSFTPCSISDVVTAP